MSPGIAVPDDTLTTESSQLASTSKGIVQWLRAILRYSPAHRFPAEAPAPVPGPIRPFPNAVDETRLEPRP